MNTCTVKYLYNLSKRGKVNKRYTEIFEKFEIYMILIDVIHKFLGLGVQELRSPNKSPRPLEVKIIRRVS